MKILTILFLSAYIFLLLGFLLHTSGNPVFFGKYSVMYFMGVIFFFLSGIIVFFQRNFLVNRLYKNTKKRKRINKKVLLLLLCTLCIVILSVELFMRHKLRGFEQISYRYSIDDIHPFLQSKLSKTQIDHINSMGFRSEEIERKKNKNTFRIVVLGGSTVLNREVRYKSNALFLLEERLQKKYPDKIIEIINAGKDWYTTEHSLIQYLFLLQDLDPNMVIMWHGINDLYASCTPSEFNYGIFKSDYSHLFGAISKMSFSYFSIPPIFSIKLVSVDLLGKSLVNVLYSDITQKIRHEMLVKEAREFVSSNNNKKVPFPSLISYERNLRTTILFMRTENVAVLIGNQPSLYKKNPTVNESVILPFPEMGCTYKGKKFSLSTFLYGLRKFNLVTRSVAESENIDFIDLDAGIPKQAKYFVDSVHFSEIGNRKLAELLYAHILQKGIIEADEE